MIRQYIGHGHACGPLVAHVPDGDCVGYSASCNGDNGVGYFADDKVGSSLQSGGVRVGIVAGVEVRAICAVIGDGSDVGNGFDTAGYRADHLDGQGARDAVHCGKSQFGPGDDATTWRQLIAAI